jgi:hypothetical protein
MPCLSCGTNILLPTGATVCPSCLAGNGPNAPFAGPCARCGSGIVPPGKRYCLTCRLFALAKGGHVFRVYSSRNQASDDLVMLLKNNQAAESFAVVLDRVEPPPPFEILGEHFFFTCGNDEVDSQYYDKAKVTIGGEKEVASLTPKPVNALHSSVSTLKALYYGRRLLKFFVSVKASNNLPVRSYLVLWGEVEMTGDTTTLRVEFASAVINTDDETTLKLIRRLYEVMATLEFDKMRSLEGFANAITTAARKDKEISALIKRFACGTGQNISAELVVAANKVYSSQGPLPITISGKGPTATQLVDPGGVQLNYLVPLKNLGYLPPSWVETCDHLWDTVAKASGATALKSSLEMKYGSSCQRSFFQVFVHTSKLQQGAVWFLRAQIAAHWLVEEQLTEYQKSGASLANVDPLLLKSIFTVYLMNAVYEYALATGGSTAKDSLGHLVKSAPLDLVRLCTTPEERAFLVWFSKTTDFLKTLNLAVLKSSRFVDKNDGLKLREGTSHPSFKLLAKPFSRPKYLEQLHEVTFTPGFAPLFYAEQGGGNYVANREPDAPTDELRTACLSPTSNVFKPVRLGNEWHVLIESRSPLYLISQYLVPGGASSASKQMLDRVQSALWS